MTEALFTGWVEMFVEYQREKDKHVVLVWQGDRWIGQSSYVSKEAALARFDQRPEHYYYFSPTEGLECQEAQIKCYN